MADGYVLNFLQGYNGCQVYQNQQLLFVTDGYIGDTVSIRETWQSRGSYLFLNGECQGGDLFFEQLTSFLLWAAGKAEGFFWIGNPDAPYLYWNWQGIRLERDWSGTRISMPAAFHIGKYQWLIYGGLPVELEDLSEIPYFKMGQQGRSSTRLHLAGQLCPGTEEPLRISLGYGEQGDFLLNCVIPKEQENPFSRMDAGILYVADLPEIIYGDCKEEERVRRLEREVENRLAGFLYKEYMPVMAPDEEVELECRFSLFAPLDYRRTRLLFAQEYSCGFKTDIQSVYGDWMTVRPKPGAGLVFSVMPCSVESESVDYYLTFYGEYQAGFSSVQHMLPGYGEEGGKIWRLLCGMKGTEYIGLYEETSSIWFQPGEDSYYKTRGRGKAETAWIAFEDQENYKIPYFSQPEQAILYARDLVGAPGGGTLAYYEQPAKDFEGKTPPVPMAFYGGLEENCHNQELSREMEECFLSVRRSDILKSQWEGRRESEGAETELVQAVTPSGLLLETDVSGRWHSLGLAHQGRQSEKPDIRLTALKGTLRLAFMDSRLFLPVGNPLELLEDCSHPYTLTALDYARLKGKYEEIYGEGCLDGLEFMEGVLYETREEYLAAAGGCLGERAAMEGLEEDLTAWGGNLFLQAGDWIFDLSPENWRTGRNQGDTALLFKYCKDHSIEEYLEMDTVWGDKPHEGSSREVIRAAIRAAYDEKDQLREGYGRFIERMTDRNFTGVVFFNCPVNQSGRTKELEFLLSTLNKEEFCAHHLGFSQNEVRLQDGGLFMKKSSVFGLVDYRENNEIYYENEEIPDFDFATTKLFLLIQNSAVAKFSAVCELSIHKLFGSPVTKYNTTSGSSLVLDGSYQQQGDSMGYVFALRENADYGFARGALTGMRVKRASMNIAETVMAGKDGGGNRTAEDVMVVKALFDLSGAFSFYQDASCDLFSYGEEFEGLEFTGLRLEMEMNGPILLQSSRMKLIGTESAARRDSFADRFPVFPERFVTMDSGEETPAAFGYAGINCPVRQTKLDGGWYGIQWQVPLGSMGELEAKKDWALRILTAWDVKDEGGGAPRLYIGALMPGIVGETGKLKLQGVMEIGFKMVELIVLDGGEEAAQDAAAEAVEKMMEQTLEDRADTENRKEYQIRLRDFGIRLLGFSFPPGSNAVYLMGEKGMKLGWYGAYVEE